MKALTMKPKNGIILSVILILIGLIILFVASPIVLFALRDKGESFCLGFKALGFCNYNPKMPYMNYFSIGESISAFALLFAIIEMFSSARFKIKWAFYTKQKLIYRTLFFIATGLTILAALLPNLPFIIVPLISYPLFWEILAAILIMIAAFIALSVSTRPIKANKKNLGRLFNLAVSYIAKNNEEELYYLANELTLNLKLIVKLANKYDPLEARIAKEEEREYKVPEEIMVSLWFLDLLSDQRFCNVVVNYNPGFAIQLTKSINEGNSYRAGYSLVQKLVEEALLSSNSIFRREEEFYGLGNFSFFSRAFFGNYNFVSSQLSPLDAWHHWEDEFLKLAVLKKFGEALKMATEAYFIRPTGGVNALRLGMEHLSGSASFYMSELKITPEGRLWKTEEYQALREIGKIFKDLLDLISKNYSSIPEAMAMREGYDRFDDISIYGAIAYAIYDFIESLSTNKEVADELRIIGIELLDELFPSTAAPNWLKEIQNRFLYHLKEKMKSNFQDLYYPMVSRFMFDLYGFYYFSDNRKWKENVILKELYFLLRNNLRSAFEKDEKRAGDLLPEQYKYDSATNRIEDTKNNRFLDLSAPEIFIER